MIDKIFNQIINNFDFAYIVIINILTYIIIKFIDIINKDKIVSIIIKRLCLLFSIIIITIIYISIGYNNKIILVNSAICSPVFYSWIIRPILIKFNIGYKQFDNYLN